MSTRPGETSGAGTRGDDDGSARPEPWRWLHRGELPAGCVVVEEDRRPLALPEALRDAIAEHWRRAESRARSGGVRLFDGALAQYLGHVDSPGSLQIRLGRTSYKHWLYCAGRRDEIEARFGPGFASRPLALCAALRTADGRLLVQERSQQVAEGAGLLHVPGGHLDPDRHRREGELDPESAMLAELSEELGLASAELTERRLLGLIENRQNGKPELLYSFRCELDATAIERRAAASHDRFEFAALHFVPGMGAELAAWAAENEGRLAVPSQALLAVLSSSL